MGEPIARAHVAKHDGRFELDVLLSDSAVNELAATGRFELAIDDPNHIISADDASTPFVRIVVRRQLGNASH